MFFVQVWNNQNFSYITRADLFFFSSSHAILSSKLYPVLDEKKSEWTIIYKFYIARFLKIIQVNTIKLLTFSFMVCSFEGKISYNDAMNNPFPYSLDNKRYNTFNYYSKSTFGAKIYKVPLDASFTCPNRDGTISDKGCLFCAGGSDAFPKISDENLLEQYHKRKEVFVRKWPDGIPYVYFQSYSNTYAPLERLQKVYQPFIDSEEIKGIVIATRSDCLDEEKIAYLDQVSQIKPVWIELGLQSIHEKTLQEMNRGHDYNSFKIIIDKLAQTNLKVSVHLINGWPGESKEMMLQTAWEVGRLPIEAVKFHMLHVCKSTPLGQKYQQQPFDLLTKEEYVEIVARQLSYLNPEIVIERLTGDALIEELLAPKWTIKKISVINDIDKKMVELDLWQGKNYQK